MKTLKLLLLLLLCGFLPISCFCDKPHTYATDIESVSLEPRYTNHSKKTIAGDSLEIELALAVKTQLIASNWRFIHSAYATSCPDDNFLDLSDPIDSIIIRSDKSFRGIQANSSLNSLVHVIDSTGYWNSSPSAYNYFVNSYNNYAFISSPILLIKSAADTLNQKFRVSVYTKSGAVYAQETEVINW